MYSSFDYEMADALTSSAVVAGITTFFMTYMFVIIAVGIITIIGMWLLYKKAGKPGWGSLIPIYREVLLFKMAGISPWLLLLYLIPFVNAIVAFVLTIVVAFKLAKAFGKDIGYGFGLWLLPTIFYLILAFGDAKYVGPNGAKAVSEEK